MHIFICWSGHRGNALAKALQAHLPRLIPGFRTDASEHELFVSDDIEKGSRWFDAVEEQLEKADAGLVCVTREALQSGWIHFEAGALARAVRKKNAHARPRSGTLYTYLLGVEPGELKGPLGAFQSTRFDRDDTKRLCIAIAASVSQPAAGDGDWERVFDKAWLAFATEVNKIGPVPANTLIPVLDDIFRRKTFNEPLDECTRQGWIDRFAGARETMAGLKAYTAAVTADDSYIVDLYNELIAQLDGYAMNMGALLLKEERFAINPEDGKLQIGNGIKIACESRRARVRALVTHLLAPNGAPVLEHPSRQYAKLPSFDAKKTILIHPAERKIKDGERDDQLSEAQLDRCAASLWEFDRIYCYLVKESRVKDGGTVKPDIASLVGYAEHELEKAVAVDGSSGLIPLHYALRALRTALEHAKAPESDNEASSIRALITHIEEFINAHALDSGRQVRDNLQQLRLLLADREAPTHG